MPRQKGAQPKRQQQPTPKSSQSSLSDAEIAYVHAQHAVQDVTSKEEHRRARVETNFARVETIQMQQRLAEQLQTTEETQEDVVFYSERFQRETKRAESITVELAARNRECESLRNELAASQVQHTDASKLLSEKLTLSREISNMKPELEHLRSQVAANENLLSEKLSLQAQLKDLRAELEDRQRQVNRAEKQDAKLTRRLEVAEADMEELRKVLSETQTALVKVNTALDQAQSNNAQKAQAATDGEVQTLRSEVANARKEREKLEKAQAKAVQSWEAEKAVLEDKLSQFRTKLRSTKEQLKETQAELESARSAAEAVAQAAPASKTSASRKRKATQNADPDAAIGTPGDGDGNKRQKRASSVVGEKSTFSITPFLNRTTSVQPEGADEPIASIEDNSPSARSTTKVLAPAGAGKSNPKTKPSQPARKRSAAAPTTLEQVEEEEDSTDENTVPVSMKSNEKEKAPPAKATKPMLKPRKSLATFNSFGEGSLQPRSRLGSVEPVTKKKRKLLGSAGGKTLMDEDDEGETVGGASGTLGGRSLLGSGQRAFGAFGKTAGGFGGLLHKQKGPLQTADGFAFSPLKKERKAMAAASRAASEAPVA